MSDKEQPQSIAFYEIAKHLPEDVQVVFRILPEIFMIVCFISQHSSPFTSCHFIFYLL
jgi:hypothetical protein